MTKKFVAGQTLLYQDKWRNVLKNLKDKNVEIPAFAERAVEAKSLNFLDPAVYNKNKKKCTFNNTTYGCFEDLCRDYNTRERINYAGVDQYPEEFKEMVDRYEKLKIIRKAEPDELDKVQLNPCNILQTRENKFSFLVHPVINARANDDTTEDCSLMNIMHRGDILMESEEVETFDFWSAYHQFRLNYETMLMMGIKIDGVVYLCQTAMYGPSACVILINTLVNLAVMENALHFNCYRAFQNICSSFQRISKGKRTVVLERTVRRDFHRRYYCIKNHPRIPKKN